MRILLSSNAPWCRTGYGVQAASLLPRLGALECVGGPENIALFAWYCVQGGLTQWGPHVVYPGHAEASERANALSPGEETLCVLKHGSYGWLVGAPVTEAVR